MIGVNTMSFYLYLAKGTREPRFFSLRRGLHRAAVAVLVRISEIVIENLHFDQGDTILKGDLIHELVQQQQII